MALSILQTWARCRRDEALRSLALFLREQMVERIYGAESYEVVKFASVLEMR